MVAHAIARWGKKERKAHWLAKLVSGESLAAFALTEPNVGSDAREVATSAVRQNDSFVLNGEKKWITGGQIANLFLVFAQCEGQPAAFLVEQNTPGLFIDPITDVLGTRASMLAALRLVDCRVPAETWLERSGLVSPTSRRWHWTMGDTAWRGDASALFKLVSTHVCNMLTSGSSSVASYVTIS